MNIENLHKIKDIKVLVYGDYMVDKYIDGNVNRISPEAPVPVIEVKSNQSKLGGTGNVINNIVSLGASVRAIGCIGDDLNGNFILESFKKSAVNTAFLKQYKSLQTIVKTRVVSKNQQFLRLDEEKIENIPESYYDFLKKNTDKIFKDIDSFVISDYGKGAVNYNIAHLLINEANKRSIPIIVDPKGTDYTKYEGATICTPNVKELGLVSGEKLDTEDNILYAGKKLCENINLKYLMLTRSEKGISLFKNGNSKKEDFPTVAKDVIDVTGAGDTVVATIAVLIPLGFSAEEICKLSNLSASVVVSKFGASTVSLNELICSISKTSEFKLIDKETAKYIADDLRDKNKKIVFTNGCFDLLHCGHLSSFKKAKTYGDVLIVAVNSDASVKSYKGDLRPIISEKDRIEMICELECVDYVILMEDKNPVNLIKLIKPDISIKGEDWKNKNVPEKEVIESYGGKIEFIKLEKGFSTTNIINKILQVYKNE